MATSPNAVAIAIAFCRAQIGDWYLWGATGPDRWDCSGLVMVGYSKGGVILPRTTGMMINVGTPVSQANLQPGDLVFPDYHHVQIYTGNGMIIEAPQSGEQVVERKMWGFWRARRVVQGVQGVSGGDIIIGGAAGPIGSQVIPGVDSAANALNSLSALGPIFAWIVDPHNWLRIATMLAGFVLIVIALFTISGAKNIANTVVKGAVNAGGT